VVRLRLLSAPKPTAARSAFAITSATQPEPAAAAEPKPCAAAEPKPAAAAKPEPATAT
jgi:hypothetical protein